MKTIYLVGPINADIGEYRTIKDKANEFGGAYCQRLKCKQQTICAPSFAFTDKDKAREFEIFLESQ